MQTVHRRNPALMLLPRARAALSGRSLTTRSYDSVRPRADMGLPSDIAANDDFARTRELPGGRSWRRASTADNPDAPAAALPQSSRRGRGRRHCSPCPAPPRRRTSPVPETPPCVVSCALATLVLGPDTSRMLDRGFTLGGLAYTPFAPVPGRRSARAQRMGVAEGGESFGGRRRGDSADFARSRRSNRRQAGRSWVVTQRPPTKRERGTTAAGVRPPAEIVPHGGRPRPPCRSSTFPSRQRAPSRARRSRLSTARAASLRNGVNLSLSRRRRSASLSAGVTPHCILAHRDGVSAKSTSTNRDAGDRSQIVSLAHLSNPTCGRQR